MRVCAHVSVIHTEKESRRGSNRVAEVLAEL